MKNKFINLLLVIAEITSLIGLIIVSIIFFKENKMIEKSLFILIIAIFVSQVTIIIRNLIDKKEDYHKYFIISNIVALVLSIILIFVNYTLIYLIIMIYCFVMLSYQLIITFKKK